MLLIIIREGLATMPIIKDAYVLKQASELVKKHEGLRLKPYRCTAGKLTIGYGRNIEDRGITVDEAESLLNNDMKECYKDLMTNVFPDDWVSIPEPIKIVVLDMRFQLGSTGFKKFKGTIKAVKDHNWLEMLLQMKDSRWYTQTRNRADELLEIVHAQYLVDINR